MDIQPLSPDDPRALGRYELHGRLGRGSQGIVFLAHDPANGAQVAVKLLRGHLDGDDAARSRFLREIDAAKRVARFCTAQVLDASVAGTQPYIVSEYIPGPSLADVIHSAGPRTGGALDRIAVNTATALGAIHYAGVVHRDFKAANVLLGPDGPVVIDFGVAKALGSVERQQVTLTGQSVGTPAYMAPEQFGDGPVGPEADIFAWGVTMVFAATGTLAFGDGSIPSVMYRILNSPPEMDGLTGPMRELVAACLDKNPAARPTARDIVDRLMSTVAPATDMPAAAAGPAANVPAAAAGQASPLAGPAAKSSAGAPAQASGAWSAVYTSDPLHDVSMRQNAGAGATGAPVMAPAGSTAPSSRFRGGAKRIPRRVLLWSAAVVAVIVLAGGAVAGLKAFGGSAPAAATRTDNAAGGLTGGGVAARSSTSASAKAKTSAAAMHKTRSHGAGGSTAGGTTTGGSNSGGGSTGGGGSTHGGSRGGPASRATPGSGAGGVNSVTRVNAPDDITSANLTPVGSASGVPYFRPGNGDYEWLDDVHRCEVIGSDGTTEGVICLDLLEDNPGAGTTYYAPVLTAYCQYVSNSVQLECANITGHFAMYTTGNARVTPDEYAWCGHSNTNPCNNVKNYWADLNKSSWLSVSTAAGNACANAGGAGTACEMWPAGLAGIDIELPKSDKQVTTGSDYTGSLAIGY